MKPSLILNFNFTNNAIGIYDVQHFKVLKSIKSEDDGTYEKLDKLVRAGEVSFDFLLSDAIVDFADLKELVYKPVGLTPERKEFLNNVNQLLEDMKGFEVGNKVLFMDKEYTLYMFDFSSKPITVELQGSGTTIITATLDSLTKVIPCEFTKGKLVRIKGNTSVYQFQSVDAEGAAILLDETRSYIETPIEQIEAYEGHEIAHAQFANHLDMTMAGPANNEANKPKFIEGQTVFVKNHGLKIYTLECFDDASGDNLAILFDSEGEQHNILESELLSSLHDGDKNEANKPKFRYGETVYGDASWNPDAFTFVKYLGSGAKAIIKSKGMEQECLIATSRLSYTPYKEASVSDGSTASYYELPAGATELQHLISYKDMNAQMGEIFRATYRYGQVDHSAKIRDAKKIKYYIEAEIERLEAYEGENQ